MPWHAEAERPRRPPMARLLVMDLHVIGPLASPAERAAVDAVLGPAESAWRGGERDPKTEGHVARGGHDARSHRDLLIPALHAVQSRIGWISQPALNYVCRRLSVPPAEAYGVATFYALFATKPRPPVVAHVCDDIACRLAGAEAVAADLERSIGPAGEPSADGDDRLAPIAVPRALRTGTRGDVHGRRDRAVTQVAAPVDAAGIAARLAETGHGIVERTATSRPTPSVPQAGEPGLKLLARVGVGRPDLTRRLPRRRRLPGPGASPHDRRGGGHRGGHQSPGSSGRGGAAFPTGRKWAARREPGRPAALPRLQRRRVRARHVQGSGPHGGRSVRGRRGDGDRGVRGRRVEGVPLHPRRVPARRGADDERDRRVRRGRACSATSRSSSAAAPAPTSAARRRRSSSRSRASAASHATSRRSRSRSACSASRRRSTTSRRSSTSS